MARAEEPLVIDESMLASSSTRPRPSLRAPLALPNTKPLVASDRRGERIDFEQGMSYFPPLTLLLIGAIIAAFVWELRVGALASQSSIVAAGALSRTHVFGGDYWRLLSAGFLHGSFEHLMGNCASLYILGMACEHGLGTIKTALVYVAALLAGSWMSILQHVGPSVGASGAIFGIMGAVVVMFIRWRHVFHLRDGRVGIVILVWAGYTLFLGQVNPVVDNAAHIGGFLAGALLALGLRPTIVSITHLSAQKGD